MEWFLDCGSMGSRQASEAEASSPVLRAADSVVLEFDESRSNRSSKQVFFVEAADSPPQQEKEDFLDLLLVKHYPDRVAVFDASKKIRRKSDKQVRNDYCKNICGYITRRICREFLSDNYREEVQGLCCQNNCPYDEAHRFYLSKIELVTGPSHFPLLFVPSNNTEEPIKRTFRSFFRWFLKQRYVRYLASEGKMTDKRAYIDYKNRVIASFLQSKEDDEPSSSKERDCKACIL